jgi:hypothetical protein
MQWLYGEDMNGQYQCCLEIGVLKHPALSTGGHTVTATVMSLIMNKTLLSWLNYAHVLLSSDIALKITR